MDCVEDEHAGNPQYFSSFHQQNASQAIESYGPGSFCLAEMRLFLNATRFSMVVSGSPKRW